jgi:hypothetical protein
MILSELLERVKQLGGTIVMNATQLDLRPPRDNPAAACELQALVPLLQPWQRTILHILKVSPKPANSTSLEIHPVIVCELCRSLWYCSMPEVLQLAVDPHWCSRGGSPPVRNSDGRIVRGAEPRCPFKPTRSGGTR